jgi:hypothetical protein
MSLSYYPPPSAGWTEKRWGTIMHEPHVSPNIPEVTVPNNSGTVCFRVSTSGDTGSMRLKKSTDLRNV